MLVFGLRKHRIRNYNKFSKLRSRKKFYYFKKYGAHLTNADLTSFPTYDLNYKYICFAVPSAWEITMLKSPTRGLFLLYLYSKIYYFFIPININYSSYHIDPNTSTISIHTLYPHNCYRLYWGVLREVFSAINKPIVLTIKFKGKGYYIFKNKRSTITPQFGYAHRLFLYAYFVSVVFRSKTRVLLFGLIKSDLVTVGVLFRAMRTINIFTGRGVRFNRQVIYKKTGKVSTYR